MAELTERGEVKDVRGATKDDLLRENYWLREVIETRLNAMDKALELIQAIADKVPSETDLAIGRVKELHEEKFKALTEKIDNSAKLGDKTTANLSNSLDNLKERFIESEGTFKKGSDNTWGIIAAVIGAVVGLTFIATFVINQTKAPAPVVIDRPA